MRNAWVLPVVGLFVPEVVLDEVVQQMKSGPDYGLDSYNLELEVTASKSLSSGALAFFVRVQVIENNAFTDTYQGVFLFSNDQVYMLKMTYDEILDFHFSRSGKSVVMTLITTMYSYEEYTAIYDLNGNERR